MDERDFKLEEMAKNMELSLYTTEDLNDMNVDDKLSNILKNMS